MKVFATFLATVALASGGRAAELLVNGDFEHGAVGFTSGYVFSPSGLAAPATYAVVTDPRLMNSPWYSFGNHTPGGTLMYVGNGATSSGATVWAETATVRPNAEYAFSGWVSSSHPSSPARFSVVVDGVPVGQIDAPNQAGVWVQFSVSAHAGPGIAMTVSLVDMNLAYVGNDFVIDDLSLRGAPPGDIDGDGDVDIDDYDLLAYAYGSFEGDLGYNVSADLDADGDVDIDDYDVLAAHYGELGD